MAVTRGLHDVAPYFVDADAGSASSSRWPEGGKTVINFPNHHLSYLITWYALALMVLGRVFTWATTNTVCAGIENSAAPHGRHCLRGDGGNRFFARPPCAPKNVARKIRLSTDSMAASGNSPGMLMLK